MRVILGLEHSLMVFRCIKVPPRLASGFLLLRIFQPLEVVWGQGGTTGFLKFLLWLYFYFDGNKIYRKLSRAWGAPTPRPGTCPRFLWMGWVGVGVGAVSMRHPAVPRQAGFLIKFMGPSAWKGGAGDVVA